MLVEQRLTPLVPSTVFDIDSGQEAWASVVADPDYSASAVFSRVANLHLIEAGSEPQIREDVNGFPIVDDPALRFDFEGDWRLATTKAGSYL